jgi:hypothetical protein
MKRLMEAHGIAIGNSDYRDFDEIVHPLVIRSIREGSTAFIGLHAWDKSIIQGHGIAAKLAPIWGGGRPQYIQMDWKLGLVVLVVPKLPNKKFIASALANLTIRPENILGAVGAPSAIQKLSLHFADDNQWLLTDRTIPRWLAELDELDLIATIGGVPNNGGRIIKYMSAKTSSSVCL